MNFLGHLYFSTNDCELMYANLFGDFVKGSHIQVYPKRIQEGILLHREIDNYIDHHPSVTKLLHFLYPDLPRIAGIAVDLYFDHLLAKNWLDFHPTPLAEFTQNFYGHEIDRTPYDKPHFWYMIDHMVEGNWLYNYQFREGLEFASSGLSRRISFKNNLQDAPVVFEKWEQEITLAFREYMRDAITHFQSYIIQHKL